MVTNFVKNYLEEYNQAQVKQNLFTGGRHNQWTTPCVDRYEVNFDEALDKSFNKDGIGVIIQNSERPVIRAHMGHKLGMMDVFMMEANAVISALEFAQKTIFMISKQKEMHLGLTN